MSVRSWLFVPGDSERKLANVAASEADAVIVDLEDAVSPARKQVGRELTVALLRDAAARHRATWVRINAADTPWFEDDLAAAAEAGADGLVLPKISGPAELRSTAAKLRQHGAPLPLLPLTTETAAGVTQLPAYRDLPASVAALTWGAEDLAADIGASTNREASGQWLAPFELARALCLLAAAACGIPAVDTVYTDFRDTAGLSAYAAQSRRLGFAGMLAIHPDQVPTIHAAFTPSAAELADARAVLAALAAAGEAGVAVLDGRMLDEPHRRQAERVLALASAAR